MKHHGAALAFLALALVLSCASITSRVQDDSGAMADRVTYTLVGVPIWTTEEPVASEGATSRARTRTMYRYLSGAAWAGFVIAVVMGCLTSTWKTWGAVSVGCAGSGLVLSTMAAVGHWLEYAMMCAVSIVGLWMIWTHRRFAITQLLGKGRHDEQ